MSLLLDEKASREAEALNSLSGDQSASLGDIVLSFLINPAGSNFQEILGEFAGLHKISAGVLKAAAQILIVVFQTAMKNGSGQAQLEQECTQLGMSPEIINSITEIWIRKYSQVVSSLFSRVLTNNQLVDLDWSFGVTAATDDCDHLGKTYLQLKMTVDMENGRKDIFMELSLEQFYQFLAAMEKCKSYLDYLNPV